MTRNRIAKRRREAEPRRAPKRMPLKASCRGCLEVKQVDSKTELCPECARQAPIDFLLIY